MRLCRRQATSDTPENLPGRGFEAVFPNSEAELLDQVREVLRLRHYSIPTMIYTHAARSTPEYWRRIARSI